MANIIRLVELIILGLLLVTSTKTANGSRTQQCPSYCTCDLFDNLNRADCSGQKLITPNVEVPTGVELLNLSYNDITTLDNSCFQGLIYLMYLIITHNSLHTIYLDAFSPLKEAISIDLSYNRLEYFDERIFEINTKLTRLDLSGNKFMTLQNKPFLRSKSIQYLKLHDAQVSYIYPLMFIEMPALREVDISDNLMITLSSSAFHSLKRLELVNLEKNRWICDESLDDTLKLLKKRGVVIKLSSCAISELKRAHGESPKFERMMEAPLSQIPFRESTSIGDVWKPKKRIDFGLDEAATCELQDPDKICQLHRNCLANLRILIEEKIPGELPAKGQYTTDDLYFVFFTGISLGVAVVTCLVTCTICLKRCCATQKKISQSRRERARVATAAAPHRPIPPPIPARQRRSTRRPINPPEFSRSLSSPARRELQPDSNQSDFATFISRLFERPSRHQYRRRINENTAHMIRRLSQSNLFNNRLSQHFIGNRSANSENVQQTEPFIYPLAIECRPTSDQPQVHLSSEERWQPARVNMSSAPPRCPETPPPSYGDAVKPNWEV